MYKNQLAVLIVFPSRINIFRFANTNNHKTICYNETSAGEMGDFSSVAFYCRRFGFMHKFRLLQGEQCAVFYQLSKI